MILYYLGGGSTFIVQRFNKVLDLYLQASGDLINHNKCQIYAWNVNKNICNEISSVFQVPHNETCVHIMVVARGINLYV
jgi:hypothetical protein